MRKKYSSKLEKQYVNILGKQYGQAFDEKSFTIFLPEQNLFMGL